MKKIFLAGAIVVLLLAAALYFLFPSFLLDSALRMARLSVGLDKKCVQVDNHRIAYLEGGKGDTVLLLHGFGGNKDYWIQWARHLTGRYHVVIPDLPGFGESTKLPAEKYDAVSQVKRLARFTETLGIDRFHLAGNSFGGMIAAMYAADYPARVATLALLAPAGLDAPRKSEFFTRMQKGENLLLIGKPEDFERSLALSFTRPPYIPAPFKKVILAQAMAQREFNNKVMGDIIGKYTSLEPLLPGIQAPVLIIWGEQDRILDVSGVQVLEKHLKRHETVIVRECGHIPMIEKPEETALAYGKFLDRHTPSK